MSATSTSHGEGTGRRDGLAMLRDAPVRERRSLRFMFRWIFRLGLIAVLAVAVGFVAFAGHVSALTTPQNPKRADAIIVLTGGLNRLDAGVSLLNSGKGKRLLISGVHPTARLDDLREATGGDPALFACCVDIDHVALDTIGNAAESSKWLKENQFRSIILVTNNYHMPRSLLEMRRLLNGAEIQPYPVVTTRLADGGWLADRDALRVIATEYAKYVLAMGRSLTGLDSEGRAFAPFTGRR